MHRTPVSTRKKWMFPPRNGGLFDFPGSLILTSDRRNAHPGAFDGYLSPQGQCTCRKRAPTPTSAHLRGRPVAVADAAGTVREVRVRGGLAHSEAGGEVRGP